MKVFLLRWIVLFASVGLSYWLTRHISLESFLAVIALISISWLSYTLYCKRAFKWSLLSYIATPVLIWSSALALMIFMRAGIQHLVMIGAAFLLSWVWSSTLSIHEPQTEEDVFRGNLLSYINSFILFFTASALFGAVVFITYSEWYALLIISVLSFILHLQTMQASHVKLRRALLYSLVASLLITELFASLLFWPSAFLVSGIIITVAFYMLTGVSRCMLTSVLSRKLIGKYLAWGSFIISAILITADWQ